MMTPFPGFETAERNDGLRYWNADATLGVAQNDNGSWSLLDSEGYPTNHALPTDHAQHILRVLARESADVGSWQNRWDYYATASGAVVNRSEA